jgi:hypothetical protein
VKGALSAPSKQKASGLLPVTRREVLLGASVAVGAGTLSGCVTPDWETVDEQSGEPVIDFYVHRAEDQLRLRFKFWNAEIIPLAAQAISLRKRQADRPYLVRVEFPEQHVYERSFLEEQANGDPPRDPPVSALLSGRSRLVFEIDWFGHHFFPLTLENLLDWSTWRMQLVPSPRPQAAVAPPKPFETCIELPARLILSPGDSDRWATSRFHPQWGQRVELWHARLLADRQDARPTVRAVWSPDFNDNPPETYCFRSSLTPRDRSDLVRLTHTSEHGADPVPTDLLLLTSQGGWLRLRKEFDRTAPANKGLLKSWEHRAEQGRDEFVQVERAAVLYPFGFSVSVIVTTERKLNPSPAGAATAYLRQRIQIKFEELERAYDFWDMPFVGLSPLDKITPPLDDPEDLYDGHWEEGYFWPKIGGKEYEFRFVGTDHDLQPVTFTAPLLCIMEVDANAKDLLDHAMATYSGAQQQLRRRSMAGAQIATSPSANIGRTAVSVDQMDFDGRLMVPGAERHEIPWRGFEPKVPLLSARPSGATANHAVIPGDPTWFEPYDLAAPDNHNEVFLVAHAASPRTQVTFGGRTSDSGAILAPRFSVGGISRINGVFGAESQGAHGGGSFASGTFNPADFFGSDAKVFGGVSLRDIFTELVLKPAGISAPAILSQLEAHSDSLPYWGYTFTWETDQLQSSPQFGDLEPIFLVAQDAGGSVPQNGVPTMLSAHGSAIVPVFEPDKASAKFDAQLTNFCLQLVAFGEGIRLRVNSCSFASSSGSKSRFNIDIVDYELVGTMMSFVKLLQGYLSKFTNNSPIEISPQGVTLSLPSVDLPPITLGAFNLDNIKIISGAALPFDGSPLDFWFALSSPTNPFMVTVGPFGGGGYIRLDIDAEGVKSVDAGLSFGAYKEISIGPLTGQAYVLGGLGYASKRVPNPVANGPPQITSIDYCAFVRAGGSGTLLGFLSVGIDYDMGLFIEKFGSRSRMHGAVEVIYSVKIGFFKKTVQVHFEKNFEGSDSQRSPENLGAKPAPEHITADQWREYRRAFA